MSGEQPRPGAFRGFASEATDESARELLEAARDPDERRERRLLELAGVEFDSTGEG